MEASKSLSCENNNISLFSALPESSNMYSNKDSNLISDLKEMYDKMKELIKKCTHNGGGSITDKNGKVQFDQKEIAKRWVEYIKELYDDD